jgi:hypothetical protein
MKPKLLQAIAATGCCACLVTFNGCGGKDEDLPRTYPVSGLVTYKGQPIDEAQVTFYPQGPGNPGTGRTEPNGRFVLTTYDALDGAVPGIHVVTVQLFPEGGLPGMEVETTGATPIPLKYADQATSTLTAEVKTDGANDIKLELTD